MKIEVELPGWCEGRHIYVLAGIELAAYQHVGGPMLVKTARCDMCGKCCEKLACSHVKTDGEKMVCGFGLERPFGCCISIGSLSIEGCTETFDGSESAES